jgi:selenocysteine lyase/cysteine desulfurase
MIDHQRHLFSLPDDLHYLNCASRSPLPNTTVDAGRQAVERMAVPQSKAPDEYFAASDTLRGLVSELIGCRNDQVAITPAVSYGIGIAAHNWPLRPGQNVVTPEEEFPSDVYAWMAACERSGATMRTVSRPAGIEASAAAWSAAMVGAIDESTAVVTLSTVHWTDGLKFDLEAISDRARDVGALLVIDATQSLGASPFDYERIRPDLLLCSTYKWLFGPDQFALAVVGDRLVDAPPFEHHWSNREGSEDTTGTGLRPVLRSGARRFDVGGHNNGVPLAMLNTSLGQVLGWGTSLISNYCRQVLKPLEDWVDASTSFNCPASDDHAAHIIGIRASSAEHLDRAMNEAGKRNVKLSRRGSSLRVSPHMYTTSADIEALIAALDAAE